LRQTSTIIVLYRPSIVFFASGLHLRVLRRDHKCRKDPLVLLKKAVNKAADEVRQYEEDNISVPGKKEY
jgi:hypothetical protein